MDILESLALVLQSKSGNFNLHESKANAHAGIPFDGVSRFAVPTFKSDFGRVIKEQQPFGGVGRSRLSCKGPSRASSG